MRRVSKWRARARAAVVVCVVALAGAGPVGQAPAPAIGGLPAFFQSGGAWQDRNHDDVIDFVDARLMLGSAPDDDELAAAADVAARLGYETSAMNLPVVTESAAGTPIAVGRSGLARAGLPLEAVGAATLAPGQGVVATLRVGERDGLAVVGADGPGTRAAADVLAGRLPHVWEPKGATLAEVADGVRQYLAAAEIEVQAVSVPAVYVTAGGDALDRLEVEVELASSTALAAARTSLARLARARAGGEADVDQTPVSTPGARLIRVRLSAAGATQAAVDVPRAAAPEAGPLGRRPGGAKASLDLSTLYQNEGLLGDSDNNLIPDRVEAVISATGDGTARVVDLAARLGLESTGITIPMVVPPAALGDPKSEPTLVLVGQSHPLVDELVKAEKFTRPALEPGQGLIQVVRKAFGEKSAVIVTGGDARGVARALEQLAERFPHVWQRGKDRTTLDDVEREVQRFLAGRSPAGQAAMALYKLDQLAGAELAGLDLEQARVTVFVEKPADGLEDVVRQAAAARIRAGSLEVAVEDLDVQHARPIEVNGRPISETFEVPSEVDEFWREFRTRVVPAVRRRQPVTVEARLSEPPEIRASIADAARAELVEAGASEAGTSVTVLSAYKQGYSWLYDVVRPALEGKPIDRLTIRYAEIGPPPEWKQQAMFTPTRWLLEIYPIDEVLARDLPIDLDRIHFEKGPIGSPAYEVVAVDASGAELFRQDFEPKFVVRPYFVRFPEYEKVRVTTGWLNAVVAGRTVADQRIETDPERFWDHYQSVTLPAIYDYVMAQFDGKPDPDDAPHFGELTVELSLSEPNYRIGVDQEQIASMEAMHEEIYFGTLHFFDVLGRYARGQALDYPGRVIPVVRPKADGKAGRASIRFTGFGAAAPEVRVEYRERGGHEGVAKRRIPKIAVTRPEALAATVRAGVAGLERLDLRVKVDTDRDERATLVERSRADRVDAQMLSAEQVTAVLGHLERLRQAGLYADALAYHDLGALVVAAGWTWDVDQSAERIAPLAAGAAPTPFPDIRRLLPAGYQYRGEPLVQWDTPIPPIEAYGILARMSTFPEATVYKVGESYLGQDVWAMDLMPPVTASHWSQAKMTTLKPTVVYSARQHANEVSSTSHVLKLAEMLLTDPEYRRKLDTVNVVIHPITNADGAQLAYDLQKITPNHMLHAGYLGSLGVDMTSAQWDADAIYPESGIRPKIWRTWLPDVFLNPHGYPSHEWVQLFSEYAGWVRNRVTESRDWWSMRGWFVPGFGYLDDPKYPRHKAAAFRIRERVTEMINAAPDVRALNERAYARYRRYGFAQDDETFKLDFTNGVLIYTAIKGSKASQSSNDFVARQPNVTIWSGSTEAPDETARGDWMVLVATAGLQWDKAVLEYLLEGPHEIERKGESYWGAVGISMNRPRPPKTDEAKETDDHRPERQKRQ